MIRLTLTLCVAGHPGHNAPEKFAEPLDMRLIQFARL